MPAIHEWSVGPIVTLVSEYWESDKQWHDEPNAEKTFDGGIENILKIQLEFKYKKPYGGSAGYQVLIEQLTDSRWSVVHAEQVYFFPDDDQWNDPPDYREYELYTGSTRFWEERRLHFRISASIEGPGHLDTGSGSGSLGYWGPWDEPREFTAIFTPAEPAEIDLHIARLEETYLNRVAFFKAQRERME